MQRTLTIDDDVLAAAEDLAEREHKTLDEVISELSRKALDSSVRQAKIPLDFPVLEVRDLTPITLELVNRLRDGLD